MYLNKNSKILKCYKAGKRINSFYISKDKEGKNYNKSGKKENSFYLEKEKPNEQYEIQNIENINEIFFYDDDTKKIKSKFEKMLD